MNQYTQSLKRMNSLPKNKKQTPLLQPQLENTLVHLETILMLAQLNSTYFKFSLNLQKATRRLQQRYFRIKMNAFLCIQNYRHSQLEVNSKKILYQAEQKTKRMAEGYNQSNKNDANENLKAKFERYKKNADYQQISSTASVKCQFKLQRLSNLLVTKNKSNISFAFFRLEHNREAIANIQSEKSSKIETNDSQKSKLFRRSVEKKQNRKSFSLQKSGLSPKHDFYVPVKYQPSRVSSQLSLNTQEKHTNNSQISSMLNRLMNKVDNKSKERPNTLQINREKKEVKHSSTRKYSTSLVNQQRQEKISELDYLRRKYKKLIDQFSWFSERFLNVIEQQEYVQ